VATILLIEDDGSIRSAINRALTERGHVVTTSNTGMSGLESAVDNTPDVVLLDLGLPDIDGLQVLAMLTIDPLARQVSLDAATIDLSRKGVRPPSGTGPAGGGGGHEATTWMT